MLSNRPPPRVDVCWSRFRRVCFGAGTAPRESLPFVAVLQALGFVVDRRWLRPVGRPKPLLPTGSLSTLADSARRSLLWVPDP